MFSESAVSAKLAEMQCITLVLDHAIQGEKHVSFEMGRGMRGSAFAVLNDIEARRGFLN